MHDLKRLAEQVLRFGVKPVYAVVPAKPGYLTTRKLSGCRRGLFDRIVQSIRRAQPSKTGRTRWHVRRSFPRADHAVPAFVLHLKALIPPCSPPGGTGVHGGVFDPYQAQTVLRVGQISVLG